MVNITHKTCCTCKKEKDITNFSKNKSTKDGYSKRCRACVKEFYSRPENKAVKAKSDKIYYQKNKKKIAEYKTKWWHDNKDQVRKRFKSWYNKNRQEIYLKQRDNRKNNLEARISHVLRTRLNKALTRKNIHSKKTKTFQLLGCTVKELKYHLESQFQEGMSWENYGICGWHIDHIIPCAYFDLTIEEQQKECFNYKNLQPLWAKDNYSKGCKYIK